MKVLMKKLNELLRAERWDIDFHLPSIEITKFPQNIIVPVQDVATISKEKRDPSKNPEELFHYIDIASIDVTTGVISNPQDLIGEEAPSRARKVVSAFDVIISTCRPTRGAIAIIPVSLHNHIASTAFSIIRAKEGINPFYLYFALRLPSTLEQFRKWSTGSSYPAILDEDVMKTKIPVPEPDMQDKIAKEVIVALYERDFGIQKINANWNGTLNNITNSLCNNNELIFQKPKGKFKNYTTQEISDILKKLPPLLTDKIDATEDNQIC